MKLARLGKPQSEIPVAVTSDGILDLRSVTSDIDEHFFENGGVEAVRAAIEQGSLPVLPDASSMRIGAPIARPSDPR